MDHINIFSLNAKELNIPKKRRMVLNDLKRAKADIAFIQETHFKTGTLQCLKKLFFPIAYHATNPKNKSKGVSILLAGRVPWTYRDSRVDPEGRYVFIKGPIGDFLITLATIYAPNDRQDTFIHATLSLLMDFTEGHLIVGGDFNVPLVPTVDTSSGTSSLRNSVHKHISHDLHNAQLTDVWRLHHSGERDYTFFSSPHKTYSRIYYFLMDNWKRYMTRRISLGLTMLPSLCATPSHGH